MSLNGFYVSFSGELTTGAIANVYALSPDGKVLSKTALDPAKAPVVVVDPRAGHGPGIGGMKQDSQIGVSMAAGHASNRSFDCVMPSTSAAAQITTPTWARRK